MKTIKDLKDRIGQRYIGRPRTFRCPHCNSLQIITEHSFARCLHYTVAHVEHKCESCGADLVVSVDLGVGANICQSYDLITMEELFDKNGFKIITYDKDTISDSLKEKVIDYVNNEIFVDTMTKNYINGINMKGETYIFYDVLSDKVLSVNNTNKPLFVSCCLDMVITHTVGSCISFIDRVKKLRLIGKSTYDYIKEQLNSTKISSCGIWSLISLLREVHDNSVNYMLSNYISNSWAHPLSIIGLHSAYDSLVKFLKGFEYNEWC